MEIDHVIMGVADPAAVARRLRNRHGMGAIVGGVHPGGTGNWLVPLQPPQYLELLYVADSDSVGPQLLAMDLTLEPLLGWAVRTDDIEAVGRRLGLAPRAGFVTVAGGAVSASWRTVADVTGNGGRPFFIQYDDPNAARPAWWADRYREAEHELRVGGFSWVEVAAEDSEMRSWTGDDDQRLRCIGGNTGLHRVAINTARGEVVLGSQSDGI